MDKTQYTGHQFIVLVLKKKTLHVCTPSITNLRCAMRVCDFKSLSQLSKISQTGKSISESLQLHYHFVPTFHFLLPWFTSGTKHQALSPGKWAVRGQTPRLIVVEYSTHRWHLSTELFLLSHRLQMASLCVLETAINELCVSRPWKSIICKLRR